MRAKLSTTNGTTMPIAIFDPVCRPPPSGVLEEFGVEDVADVARVVGDVVDGAMEDAVGNLVDDVMADNSIVDNIVVGKSVLCHAI